LSTPLDEKSGLHFNREQNVFPRSHIIAHPLQGTRIYSDEDAERATKERLAGVLMFPKTALQFADMVQKSKKGNLIEMPSSTQIEARQSLRILPA